MKEGRRNHGEGVSKTGMRKGLELAKRLGHPRYADFSGLSKKDEELYREGFDSLNRAYQLKEILGNDFSPEAASKVFAELSEQLRAAIASKDKKREEELDEKIVKIASAYGLSDYGLGNVLSCVSGRLVARGGIDIYEKMIAESELNENLKAAMEFI